MVDLVMATRVPCLLGLVEQKQHKALYPILDSLLVQLVDPLSVKAQDTAKSLLKSCGWRIANSIREVSLLCSIFYQSVITYFICICFIF